MPRRRFPARYAVVGSALGLAALYAVLAMREIHESDALWHAELGRAVLREHARTVTEPMAIDLLARHCTVHEWLWDVVTFLLQRSVGWNAVELLTVACAALVALSFFFGTRAWAPSRSLAALAGATACLSPAVLSRVRERPEIVSLMLLPVAIRLSRGLAVDASARASWKRVAALGVVTLLWAQTHATFVLAPVITAVVAGPELLRDRRRRPWMLALAVFYLVDLAASPYGSHLLTGLDAFGAGFTAQHITEWQPPTFALFDPADRPPFPLYGLCWLAIVLAAVLRRRLARRETALALLGVLLVMRGRRGVGPAAVLAGPAVSWAFDVILTALAARRARARAVWAAVVALPSLAWGAVDSALYEGTPLRLGLSADLQAPDGLEVLAAAPPGTHALTTYFTSAVVGFALDGRVRTFLDSRTPLVFGDGSLALAFAVWTREEALPRATEHYDFRVAMVGRDDAACQLLAADARWQLAAVDRRYSTFQRKDALPAPPPTALTHLSPCGPSYVEDVACHDGRDILAREVGRVRDRHLRAYLEAESAVACARGSLDADALVAALPAPHECEGFLLARTGLHAWLLASAGRTRDAADEVLALPDGPGRIADIARIAPVVVRRGDPGVERELLRPLVDAQADDAPSWSWAQLANACAELGDLRCAETNALRAAAAGHAEVGPALCFVAARSHDPAVRDDARAWLDSLRREFATSPRAAALTCPGSATSGAL